MENCRGCLERWGSENVRKVTGGKPVRLLSLRVRNPIHKFKPCAGPVV